MALPRALTEVTNEGSVMETNFVPIGDTRLRVILDEVEAQGDGAEADYLEAKSDVDLTSSLGVAKVAKFVLGAANRLPGQAAKNLKGYAVMVIGAAKGGSPGVATGTEGHELQDKARKYLGDHGPTFDLARLAVAPEREVLFVLVDPPEEGQPPYPCHKDFQPSDRDEAKKHGLRNGDIYVRPGSNTRLAKAQEVLGLHARGTATVRTPVDIQVTAGPAIHLTDTDRLFQGLVRMRSEELKKAVEEARPKGPSVQPWMPIASAGLFGQLLGSAGGEERIPRTDAELNERIERWTEDFRSDWDQHLGYLASVSGRALVVAVTNSASSFLKQPRLDVRFPGCAAVRVEDRERFSISNVVPTIIPKTRSSWPYAIALPNLGLTHVRPSHHPVDWEQDGDGVTVTLTPDALRPRVPWRTPRHDIVLLAPDDTATVRFTWSATAEGFGEQFSGEGVITVTEVLARELLLSLWDAHDDQESS